MAHGEKLKRPCGCSVLLFYGKYTVSFFSEVVRTVYFTIVIMALSPKSYFMYKQQPIEVKIAHRVHNQKFGPTIRALYSLGYSFSRPCGGQSNSFLEQVI